MSLTDDEAAALVQSILAVLRAQGDQDVLDGIDESRRLGIDETLPDEKRSELKQVARTRRRPPDHIEMLQIVLERLYQRLVVLPSIGEALRKRLGAQNVLWRVDTEFASVSRFPEVQLSDIDPQGADKLRAEFVRLRNDILSEE